jgi:hypothetical protein
MRRKEMRQSQVHSGLSAQRTSERLSQAEEEVEVAGRANVLI